MNERLAVVIPCYNEEEVLPICIPTLRKALEALIAKGKIAQDSFMLFVNDGSKDRTWELLSEAHRENNDVAAICLAKNRGHQNALLAGLTVGKDHADILISMDADLQDDMAAMEEMIDAYHNGAEIVYGVRSSRKKDSFFKRFTAEGFYRFMEHMGVETIYNHADYRLMSQKAVMELCRYQETNLYLRGMIPLLGYKTDIVYYERHERAAGESKYPLKKMLTLAFNGISSFSTKPISMILGLGLFVLFVCFCAAVYALVSYLSGNVEHGWTSIILSIWFLGGIQLLSIGIIGEYIGKIYIEVKHRPKYNIEHLLPAGEEESTDEA